jgi:putative ABC transport system permease protein
MNLALRDVRRHIARFVGTAAGLGLLLSVVVAMQGIYAGHGRRRHDPDPSDAGRPVGRAARDTVGPFAEASRLDPSVEARASAVPGVRRARPYNYQLIQREHHGAVLRIALVGLGWPDDPGHTLPLVRGRHLAQPHGEMIVDASLGCGLGESLVLAGEPYRVVGLTRNALTSGGDSVAFMTVGDTQLVAFDQSPRRRCWSASAWSSACAAPTSAVGSRAWRTSPGSPLARPGARLPTTRRGADRR